MISPILMANIQTKAFINTCCYASHIEALAIKNVNTPPPRSHKPITAKQVLAEIHDEQPHRTLIFAHATKYNK